MDTLTVHLDAIAEGARAFSLAMDKDGWTATATRKHARKEMVATGPSAIEALANLLTAMRGEPEDVADDGLEAPAAPGPLSAEPTTPDEKSVQG